MLSFETDTYTHLVTLGLLIIEKPSMMASMTPLGVLVRDRLLMGSIQAPRTLAAGNGLKDATRTFTLAELDTMQLFASASSPVLFAMVEGSAVDMEFMRRARQDVIDLGGIVRRLSGGIQAAYAERDTLKVEYATAKRSRDSHAIDLRASREEACALREEASAFRDRVCDLESLLQQLAATTGSTLERAEAGKVTRE